MTCHARRRPIACDVQGEDDMSFSTSLYHVYCAISMMVCHVRCHPTVFATQEQRGLATPDDVKSCVLSKGNDNIPRPTSSDYVCFARAMMACKTRCYPTVCAFKG